MAARVDHLVVAAASLEEGAAWCEATLGVAPAAGGEHVLVDADLRATDLTPLVWDDEPAWCAAAFEFAGNKDVGKGSIAIVDTAPTRVTMKLDMIEPFEGHNIVEFTLAPKGDATEVTWAMHGPSPFMAKLVGLFMNMDAMIGRGFGNLDWTVIGKDLVDLGQDSRNIIVF